MADTGISYSFRPAPKKVVDKTKKQVRNPYSAKTPTSQTTVKPPPAQKPGVVGSAPVNSTTPPPKAVTAPQIQANVTPPVSANGAGLTTTMPATAGNPTSGAQAYEPTYYNNPAGSGWNGKTTDVVDGYLK